MTDRAKYWQRMLTAWEASGLTQAEFCRRRGLKAVTFAWWKRQLLGPGKVGGRGRRDRGRPSADAGSGRSSFVEVAFPESVPGFADRASGSGIVAVGYEVAFPCGTSIRLPVDFDVARASLLIQAARSC